MKSFALALLLAAAISSPDARCVIRESLFDDEGGAIATLAVKPGYAALSAAGSDAEIFFPATSSANGFVATVSGFDIAYDRAACQQHSSWVAQVDSGAVVRFYCSVGGAAGNGEVLSALQGRLGTNIDVVTPNADRATGASYALVFDRDGRFVALWSRAGFPSDAGRVEPQTLFVGEGGIPLEALTRVIGGNCTEPSGCAST